MKLLFFLLVLCFTSCSSITKQSDSARQPASVLGRCVEWFQSLGGRRVPDAFIESPSAEQQALIKKLRLVQEEYGRVTLLEEQAYLLLQDRLSLRELRLLFTDLDDNLLAPSVVASRIRFISSETYYMSGAIHVIHRNYDRGGMGQKGQQRNKTAWRRVEEEWNDSLGLEVAQKNEIWKEILRRQKNANLKFEVDKADLWQVKVFDAVVVLPSGQELKILRKKKNGDLIVAIPISRVLANQDRMWGEATLEHMADKSLRNLEVRESILPDGRAFLIDVHHRISAYGKVNGSDIPFVLPQKTMNDGSVAYFTSSYSFPLSFRSHWTQVSASERDRLWDLLMAYRQSSSGPLREERYKEFMDYFGEVYRKYMGFRD